MSSLKRSRRMQAIGRTLAGPALAVFMAFPAQAGDDVTIVNVAPGQTLNAAIADVEGPVMILLPPGVTEHDAAITRNETVIIKGQGMNIATLRPAASLGPDEGVALVTQTAGFDGDFILEDLTYDRAHHPGITLDPDVATGAEIVRVYARNRVEFRNVAIHHFDYGAREDERNAAAPFIFSQQLHWRAAGGETETRTKDFIFRNVHIDFEKGGGIRHRPGGQHGTFGIGSVDRILIDADTVFRSHLCQDANLEYTVGPVWRNRGNAGPMYGLDLWVHERALIDGVWHNSDYGAWRNGGPAHLDAVIEWRMDLLNAGYADQFWHRPFAASGSPATEKGGHMIFKDVLLTSHDADTLWHDYGLRTFGDWKTITVDDCILLGGRGHPLSFRRAHNQGRITIRNTVIETGGQAVTIDAGNRIEALTVDGLNVFRHSWNETGSYRNAIYVEEGGEGGGSFTIRNVHAEDYLEELVKDLTGNDTTLTMENVQGRRRTFTLPDEADFGITFDSGHTGAMISRPNNPRPLWHTSADLPGVKMRGDRIFSPYRGQPTARTDLSELSIRYCRDILHIYMRVHSVAHLGLATDGDLETADRVRIGLAIGRPAHVTEWHEIEVAATEGVRPIERATVRVRRHPGGEEVEPERPVRAGLQQDRHGRWHWGIAVPWSSVGIDPEDEMFWVKSWLSFDLAYIDMGPEGEEAGALQLMDRSGLLDEKDPAQFKNVLLMFVPWDDAS